MTNNRPEEQDDEDKTKTEKEISAILDEIEAIVKDRSESVERQKEAQVMIRRAIEYSGKIRGSKEIWKRYQYVIKLYCEWQIEIHQLIKEDLKKQAQESVLPLSQEEEEELKRVLEQCDANIEFHKVFVQRIEKDLITEKQKRLDKP